VTSGIGLSEILLILMLIVIFIKPSEILKLIQKSLKIMRMARSGFRKFFAGIGGSL
jgi:Sec-independent protein translocase protein TatA